MSKDTILLCLTICICSVSGFLYFLPMESHHSMPISWIMYWGAGLLLYLIYMIYQERKK